jgi:effector-binding domain-containing protein
VVEARWAGIRQFVGIAVPRPMRQEIIQENRMLDVRTLAVVAAAAIFGVLALNPAAAQAPASPPASPPAAAPAPAEPPPPAVQPAPAPAQPADPFGEDLQVAAKTIIFMKGTATWDSAYDTLVDSFKTVTEFLKKENIKPAGPSMTIYLSTDDTGFEFRAAIPIEAPPANPPKGDIELGQSPAGKMLKFVHRGSYDAMDTTYEAITNFLDTKQLEAQETFIEEYVTDPITTAEEELVINVLVPIK